MNQSSHPSGQFSDQPHDTLSDVDPFTFESFAIPGAPLTEGQIYRERLLTAVGGFAYFELIYSACKLDLFGYLQKKGKSSREKVCEDLGISEYSARVLLLGCSYLGLVQQIGGKYSSTALAEPYSHKHPRSLWPLVEAHHSIVYRPMHRLSESLVAGTNLGLSEISGSGATLYERLAEHPALEKIFHQWMFCVSKDSGLSQSVLEVLQPTLGEARHLVDYGGGDANNAINICKFYPHLKVTIFDSSSVCQLARENIKKAGMERRIFLHEGNFLEDPFVKGVDAVLFCHISNIYSKEANTQLLRKSHESLVENGAAILFNTVTTPDEDGPAVAPFLSAYFLGLATGEGMVYTLADYDQWTEDAGFRDVEKIELPDIQHGLVIARK
jgi:hypothetical protein